MTTNAPTDELIASVVERRAASASADGLLDRIIGDVESMPMPRGGAPATPWAVALVGAILLAIAIGFGSRNTGVVNLSPTVQPSPTAAASTTTEVRPVVASGIDGPPLPAGRWRTAAYEPVLEFTVSEGTWTAGIDIPRQFWMRAHLPGVPADEFDVLTVLTITNVFVDPCERGAEQTRAWTETDPVVFLDWIERHTGQDLGPRRSVTLLGLDAVEVEFTSNVGSECVLGYVPITDIGRLAAFGTAPEGQPVRYAVAVLDGLTVLVGTWTDDPARWDAVRAAADAVLETMEIVR